jgi:drug/metabolite transporter (DMT)-like permease
VPTSALLLALAAAFVHALWNLLVAGARDSEAATAVALVVSVLAFAPVAAVVRDVEAAAWPYIGGSAAFHLLYFGLLGAAYRRSELSLVYPLARGLAPVLVLVVGIVALGAGASVAQAAAVCLVAVGVLLVRGLGGGRQPSRGALFGLAIACCTAGYTLVDSEGVQHANPLAYLELALIAPAAGYFAAAAATKGLGGLRAEVRPRVVLAGLAMFGAYALVLAALQLAPAAPVAAVRETSIVIATAGAALVLKERFGPVRAVGATLVVAGVILLGI